MDGFYMNGVGDHLVVNETSEGFFPSVIIQCLMQKSKVVIICKSAIIKKLGNAFRPGAFITVYNPLQRLDNALTTCYNVLYNP